MASTGGYGRVQPLTLPSGIKVTARRPSVLSLIESGGFPQELTLEVFKLLDKKNLDVDDVKNDIEGIRTWARLINAFIVHVLAEPKVVEGDVETNTQVDEQGFLKGSINIADILDGDKHVLFLFGNDSFPGDEELKDRVKRAKALVQFRDGAQGDDAGHGGEEVRTETVGAPVLESQEPERA